MTLELKMLNKIDVNGVTLYLDDVTGAYSDPDNKGGWGIPNTERKAVALLAVIEKIHESKESTLLAPITPDIIYDDTLSDDYISKYEFSLTTDGVHNNYLVLLDPIHTGGEGVIPEGHYYYNIDLEAVYVRGDGIDPDEVVSSYRELIDTDNGNKPTQFMTSVIWVPQLSLIESKLYNDYRVARQTCTNQDSILDEVVELNLNIEHAISLFDLGLYMEAESVIETQLELYK